MKAGLDRLTAAATGLTELQPGFARVKQSSAALCRMVRRRLPPAARLVPVVVAPVLRRGAPSTQLSVPTRRGARPVAIIASPVPRDGAFERWRSRRGVLLVSLPLALVLALSLSGDAG